ncbi:MAG: hypothetical protein FJ147_20520 [Deltaproteobacteria bacterium]|nr:hypothetical protein [Deltaproteobacteria bacterium]
MIIDSALIMTPMNSVSRSQTADVSLIRAALFGTIVPPLLATTALLLLRAENWSEFPTLFSFFFVVFNMSLFVSILCAPFGIVFAVLCGLLARAWLRRGDSIADVQVRMSSVGAVCGLASLWGLGLLFDGNWSTLFMVQWPASFWGTALVVGATCGWLLPRIAHISRPIPASAT